MINALIATMNHTRGMTLKLVADLSDDQLAIQPAPKTNHAAWVLGHLLLVENSLANLLDPSRQQPAYLTDAYREIYGMKSQPVADKSKYLPKQFYLDELAKLRPQIIEKLKSLPADFFSQPHPDPARRNRFPTIGEAIVTYGTWHEAYHAGQLSAWRRVQGLPAV